MEKPNIDGKYMEVTNIYLFLLRFLGYIYIYIYIYKPGHWPNKFSPLFREIGVQSRSSHTKDPKMVLDAALLNTRHYKVRIKGKVEQSKEWISALPYASV